MIVEIVVGYPTRGRGRSVGNDGGRRNLKMTRAGTAARVRKHRKTA